MSAEKRYQAAAEEMAKRLRIWKRLAQQSREAEREQVVLDVRELWEPSDEAALAEFEAAKAAVVGAVPLPMEISA